MKVIMTAVKPSGTSVVEHVYTCVVLMYLMYSDVYIIYYSYTCVRPGIFTSRSTRV